MVEQYPFKVLVVGSSPTRPNKTNKTKKYQMTLKQTVLFIALPVTIIVWSLAFYGLYKLIIG